MLVTESGQLNITTKPDSPEEDADKVTAFIAAEQAAKGEIRLEMNFTPVMAHRYLQKQINDLCKAVYAEKDLNEKFRSEFESL